MTTLLSINPHSRKGNEFDSSMIKEGLRKLGPIIECEPNAAGDVEKALRETTRAIERIVIGGGDGTIHRALPMLHETGLPCGVIPLGTANDFARSLGLSLDPDDAAVPIIAGHTRRVDIGEVNGELFVNAVGIGLGADLTRRLDHEKKQRLGVLAYCSSLVGVLRHSPHRRATITIDGDCYRTTFIQITIASGIHYGGGMTISDEAELADGLLRVLWLEPQTLLELVMKILPLRWGKNAAEAADDDKMSMCAGRAISVDTRRPIDVTADGELITKTPLQCTIHPAALEVYAPAQSPSDSSRGSAGRAP